MSSLSIKFSHKYPKLHGQSKARLLAVEITRRDKLHQDLVEYDTVYEVIGFPKPQQAYFHLPNGLLLVLVFIGDKQIPFTTIRRASGQKQAYYERNIGQWFDIIIKPEEKRDEEQPTLFDQESVGGPGAAPMDSWLCGADGGSSIRDMVGSDPRD